MSKFVGVVRVNVTDMSLEHFEHQAEQPIRAFNGFVEHLRHRRLVDRLRTTTDPDQRAELKRRLNSEYGLFCSPDPIPLYDPAKLEALTAACRANLNMLGHLLVLDDEALTYLNLLKGNRRLALPAPSPAGTGDRG
jgi:hypothetical protein